MFIFKEVAVTGVLALSFFVQSATANVRDKELAQFADQIIVDNVWNCAKYRKDCVPFETPSGELTDAGYDLLRGTLAKLSFYDKKDILVFPSETANFPFSRIRYEARQLLDMVAMRYIYEAGQRLDSRWGI